ncbi:cupin domain-containing protein [Mameliella alba]|uniref:cupin domain-containing protein n=1 Tax=Mameliella alba TaxID=561184 RepID=UPI000B531036|nr:cupin domain-containing protein [Mameliella alba]MBY6121628.1 cupin domain-containing protein [Mameliella alba]OWV40598.1 cupin [Mameliella alba]OWV59395.1 cupin [Mameliella alba]
MELNADFSKRVVIRPEDYQWRPSPANGVERMMLDRIGDEVARATTIVRFAPNSQFGAHTHGGGEEFLVLQGVFSDEHADYPVGSYVRNPIGTAHTPHIGPDGATILVKLCQFDPADTEQKAVATQAAAFEDVAPGLSQLLVHDVPGERVRIVRFAPGTRLGPHAHRGGEEVYVIEGRLQDEHGSYPAGSWIRSPDGSSHTPFSDDGCLLYIKTGHLPAVVDGSRAAE